MLRFLTSGESHGMALAGIIEGLPAGLTVRENDINSMLARRQKSYGRGNRMRKIENDHVSIMSGLRNGMTIGSPLTLYIENRDWHNRKNRTARIRKIPRPGHADMAGAVKYGLSDIQNVVERSSARETAMRTAIGAIAKIFLAEFGIDTIGHVIAIGRKSVPASGIRLDRIKEEIKDSPVFCAHRASSDAMCREIDMARAKGDTLGGIFEVLAINVPPGLGSYVHWDRKLDGRLAQMIMSIPSVKAVEIGDGIKNAGRPGSKVHDRLYYNAAGLHRRTNRAGGIEGGVTNGSILIVRGYNKPISSLRNPLESVNLHTKEAAPAPYVRSDICVVPASSVIAETLVSWTIAESFVEKFGGDSIREMKQNYKAFMKNAEELTCGAVNGEKEAG